MLFWLSSPAKYEEWWEEQNSSTEKSDADSTDDDDGVVVDGCYCRIVAYVTLLLHHCLNMALKLIIIVTISISVFWLPSVSCVVHSTSQASSPLPSPQPKQISDISVLGYKYVAAASNTVSHRQSHIEFMPLPLSVKIAAFYYFSSVQ